MLITNKILTANKVGGIEGNNKFIRKYGKLSKTEKLLEGLKLSKLENSKGEKLFIFRKLAKSEKKLSKIKIHLILMLKRVSQVS